MMTKKHYIQFAEWFRLYNLWDRLGMMSIEHFFGILRKDNPNFDHEKFIQYILKDQEAKT